MKYAPKILITLSIGVGTLGCAVENKQTDIGFGLAYHGEIADNKDGTYSVAVEASPLRGRMDGAYGLAIKDADNKCARSKQKTDILAEQKESNYFVNGVVRLKFRCI